VDLKSQVDGWIYNNEKMCESIELEVGTDFETELRNLSNILTYYCFINNRIYSLSELFYEADNSNAIFSTNCWLILYYNLAQDVLKLAFLYFFSFGFFQCSFEP
jgi:hypothetical protein